FPPGSQSRSATISIIGDTTLEPDKVFSVTLNSPVNAGLSANSTAAITIVDDDACVPLLVTSTADDGMCGTLRNAISAATSGQTITINLSAGSIISLTSGLTLTNG